MKMNRQVKGCFSDHVIGCTHPCQKRPGREDADDDQCDTGDQADRYGSVDVVLCTLLVLISNGAGHIDIGADGKSDDRLVSRLIMVVVEPTAASEELPAKRPTTMTSAALKRS